MMRIFVAMNDEACDGFQKAHGLSFWVEYNGKVYLIDAGINEKTMENLDTACLDVACVDVAFLSHGHNDHGNGFVSFLKKNASAAVYCRKKVFEGHRSYAHDLYQDISLDKRLKESDRFVFVDKTQQIDPGVFVYMLGPKTSQVSKLKSFENGCWIDDDFAHEMAIGFETPEGIVLFNSCSHTGILDTLSLVDHVSVYMGGLHLKNKVDKEEVIKIARVLLEKNIHLYTGHCTGIKETKWLEEVLHDQLDRLYAGQWITI